MDLLAIGGDKRYAYIVREARKRGISACAFGLERAGLFDVVKTDLQSISEAKYVVMPNPFDKPWSMPFSNMKTPLIDILTGIDEKAVLLLFGNGDVPKAVSDRNVVRRLDDDEILMSELARQTAEGAIHSVCERAAYELYNAKTLIIGYGRIGKALHRILSGYRADVTVVARRDEALREASDLGASSLDVSNLDQALGHAHIVFSTPPERIVDARRVGFLHRNALLVDLSGEPYGVDIDAAHSRWLHAWREPGLPGRYCPHSAGRALLDSVERAMKEERERA